MLGCKKGRDKFHPKRHWKTKSSGGPLPLLQCRSVPPRVCQSRGAFRNWGRYCIVGCFRKGCVYISCPIFTRRSKKYFSRQVSRLQKSTVHNLSFSLARETPKKKLKNRCLPVFLASNKRPNRHQNYIPTASPFDLTDTKIDLRNVALPWQFRPWQGRCDDPKLLLNRPQTLVRNRSNGSENKPHLENLTRKAAAKAGLSFSQRSHDFWTPCRAATGRKNAESPKIGRTIAVRRYLKSFWIAKWFDSLTLSLPIPFFSLDSLAWHRPVRPSSSWNQPSWASEWDENLLRMAGWKDGAGFQER